MKKPALMCLAVLLFAPSLHAQSQGAHDEEVVRNAYQKLSFIMQFSVYGTFSAVVQSHQTTPAEFQKNLNDAMLIFTLENFKAGPISEISSDKWSNVITAPRNFATQINVGIGTTTYGDNLGNVPVRGTWMTAQAYSVTAVPSDPSDQLRIDGLAKIFQEPIGSGRGFFEYPNEAYTRYVSYQVTAAYQGKVIGPYKALFLFGNGAVLPNDLYVSMNALRDTASKSLYPSGLFHTHLRDTPLIHDWLIANQITTQSCSSSAGDLCCTSTRCGIAQNDLQRDLATPLPAVTK